MFGSSFTESTGELSVVGAGLSVSTAYSAFKGNQAAYIFPGGDVHPNEACNETYKIRFRGN